MTANQSKSLECFWGSWGFVGMRVWGFWGFLRVWAVRVFEDFEICYWWFLRGLKMWLPWILRSREFLSGFLMIAIFLSVLCWWKYSHRGYPIPDSKPDVRIQLSRVFSVIIAFYHLKNCTWSCRTSRYCTPC